MGNIVGAPAAGADPAGRALLA